MYLKEEKFSLWCDFVEKRFLQGEFLSLIEGGRVNGATSNPAIFKSAFLTSPAYKEAKDALKGKSPKDIYEALAVEDIIQAADVLRPLYDAGDDGFISIEVDPFLSDDAKGTIAEGKRLVKAINRPNIMIKVPATKAGYIAMKELTSQGIHVNATLIFSVEQAIECAKALDAGIKESNKDTKAVISVFVSRFDRLCDDLLANKGLKRSMLGIMNATKCYHEINKFENENIRTLFASTGVKGDELSPSYYVDSLLYPNSVNTAPLNTIEDWVSDGIKEPSKIPSEVECDEYFKELKKVDIEINKIYKQLLTDGLEAFKVSFADLLEKLAK